MCGSTRRPCVVPDGGHRPRANRVSSPTMHLRRLLRVSAIVLNIFIALRTWWDWIYVLGFALRELHGIRLLGMFRVALFWDAVAPTLAVAALLLIDRRRPKVSISH